MDSWTWSTSVVLHQCHNHVFANLSATLACLSLQKHEKSKNPPRWRLTNNLRWIITSNSTGAHANNLQCKFVTDSPQNYNSRRNSASNFEERGRFVITNTIIPGIVRDEVINYQIIAYRTFFEIIKRNVFWRLFRAKTSVTLSISFKICGENGEGSKWSHHNARNWRASSVGVYSDPRSRHCLHFCSFAYGFAYRKKHVRYELTPCCLKASET